MCSEVQDAMRKHKKQQTNKQTNRKQNMYVSTCIYVYIIRMYIAICNTMGIPVFESMVLGLAANSGSPQKFSALQGSGSSAPKGILQFVYACSWKGRMRASYNIMILYLLLHYMILTIAYQFTLYCLTCQARLAQSLRRNCMARSQKPASQDP